jgi:acyl-CoA synthetase (AMP-forming)/AMP-acid ligase II
MQYDSFVGVLTEPVSGRSWSRDATRKQVACRIHVLRLAGFAPGDRALIHFGNRLEFFAELLAIWALGGCAIPVDARLTAFEIERLVEAAQARFNIIDDKTPEATLKAVAGSVVLNTLEHGSERSAPDLAASRQFPRLDDDALILFTSGSTGSPKGVVHTHRSLVARWLSLRHSLGLEAYRRTLCVLPTHFGHGLICNCLFPWLAGCDLFIAPPFQSGLIMHLGELLDEHRISFMSSVPSVWNLALKTARPPRAGSLKRVHVGSAPLSENNWKQIIEWAGTGEVFNAYGITETGSWVAGTTGGAVVPESGLIGEPWGSVIEVREPAASGAGRRCETGEAGMVWLQTPALMKGYFARPDLTDAAIHGGWFMTGDIGFIDERGRLFLKGRERDEINKGGMKVFPADVDEVVEQYPGTRDVCTFGFEDSFYGENVGLAVVLDDTSDRSIAGLHQWLEDRLARHKHPVKWYLLDEIPRTSRGKINRDTVGDRCAGLEPIDLRTVLGGVKGKES